MSHCGSAITFGLQILQGLLTPVIGVIALYIAWQQWKTNERKSVLDRYERRLKIFHRVMEMLRLVSWEFNPKIPDLMKFSGDTAEAVFLFGPEIPEYIDEIYKHGLDLHTARAEYRDFRQPVPEGYDHQKVVEAMTAQEKWFVGQFAAATEKFKKYLDISR